MLRARVRRRRRLHGGGGGHGVPELPARLGSLVKKKNLLFSVPRFAGVPGNYTVAGSDHSAYSPSSASVVWERSSSLSRRSRCPGEPSCRKIRGKSSRGSRGGYPLAALGSEDWCDAIHAGVFSDGRPSD